jgi:hypothetical protein
LPNNTNRSFIEQALETAVRVIRTDETIAVEPVIDRDTAGVAGSPEIANTIFGKIAASAIFVADVSIVNSGSRKRRMPNPNVLIELGFALRALGSERVVMVMNSHFGGPDSLPFDLRMRRVVTYVSTSAESARGDTRRELAHRLEVQVRAILAKLADDSAVAVKPKIGKAALAEAIRSGRGDRALTAREYMEEFCSRLFAMAPSPAPHDDDELVASLAATMPLIGEFGEISSVVAIAEDAVVARAIYSSFGKVLATYEAADGGERDGAFDFERFLGHELFVSFIAALLHERRFSLLKSLLAEELELPAGQRRRIAPFYELQRGTFWLWRRSKRLNLMSAQGKLLHDRHSDGPASAISFDHVMGADYFLFLQTEATNPDEREVRWFPPTAPYLSRTPTFLARLHRTSYATEVAELIGAGGPDQLRNLIVTTEVKLARAFGIDWHRIPEAYNPSLVASG